ncbi:MAG: GAF domain-containing protein [Candidatus Acidiferrales bacterium]
MTEHEARTKRALGALWPYPHGTGNRHGQFEGERQILELISLGAPLAGILNRLCIVIDVQIGDVISLVSLADAEENHFCSITQRAVEVGLDVFSSTGILSVDQTLLGTLEIYACDPRRPTQGEHELIERVSHLAGIALQRHADEQDFARASRRSGDGIAGAQGLPPFIN